MIRNHTHAALLSLFLSSVLLFGIFSAAVLADESDAEFSLTSASVADTEESVGLVYDLADQLRASNRTSVRTGGFTWDTEGKKRSWTYYNGIMMDAFLMMGEDKIVSYVNDFYDANITSLGKVNSLGASDNYYRENELDSIPPARALFDLIRDKTTPTACAQKYRKMIDYIYSVMMNYKVIEETGGNFKHKINNTSWETYQVALDGLYMAQPFFMELANALDDGILTTEDFAQYSLNEQSYSLSSDDIYLDVIDRMIWIGNNLYVPETYLYSHGWGPEVGLNGQYWLRAVGWYAAALADVISMLPDEYENGKYELIEIEKRLFDGMMKYRDAATGMWYNVINYGPELIGENSRNELETSGTALIAYAMMKSYVEGYLDDTYGKAGLYAFNGTVMNYLDEEGLHNVYISSGVETSPEGYLKKTYKTNEAKGVGPLMMAATYANTAAEILEESEAHKPSFATYSLILSGRLGVNVYVALPGGTAEYEGSYMAFFVNGEETDVPLDPAFKSSLTDAYGFTCYVNVLQMAEEITAVFHYGENNAETIERSFFVADYLAYIKDYSYMFEDEMVDLAGAIGDYGYYCQKYLNIVNSLDDKYAPMPDPDTLEYDFEELASLTDTYKAQSQNNDSAVDKITYTLLLDSGTDLKIYFTTKSGFKGTPYVSVNGSEPFAAEKNDGRYEITIDDLPAHKLADMLDIIIMADGESKIHISALSYANTVLSGDMNDDAKNAMASFFYYYEKAMAYRAVAGR